MFDIENHVKLAEQGADFLVELGDDQSFTVQVRKANIRDKDYFKAQAFLISLASLNETSTGLQAKLEAGEDDLSEEEVARLTSQVSQQFKVEGFSENIEILSDYVVDSLVVGWTGIESSLTGDPIPYDKGLFSRLVQSEPQVAIQIFGFAMNPESYKESVVEESEKNS